MDLVDDVDLVAAPRRCVLHGFEQFAHVVHAGARGGVDLDHVDESALVHVHATAAFATGLRGHTRLTVQALGQDAGDGGLANTAGAGEQEGVVQSFLVDAVDQGTGYVFLADQLVERAGTPLAGEYLVTHR